MPGPASAEVDAGERAVVVALASLPVSVQPAVSRGDLVLADGRDGWGLRLNDALGSGVRGALVDEPSWNAGFDLSALRRRADAGRIPVALYTRWAHNPAVDLARREFGARFSPGSFLESTVTIGTSRSLRATFLEQLALVRDAAGAVTSVSPVIVNEHGYTVQGRLSSGPRVRLVAVRTGALPESATLRLLVHDGSVTLTLPAPTTARPGCVQITSQSGTNQLPTVYETASRAAWRRLESAVASGTATRDLANFSDDRAIAEQVFPE